MSCNIDPSTTKWLATLQQQIEGRDCRKQALKNALQALQATQQTSPTKKADLLSQLLLKRSALPSQPPKKQPSTVDDGMKSSAQSLQKTTPPSKPDLLAGIKSGAKSLKKTTPPPTIQTKPLSLVQQLKKNMAARNVAAPLTTKQVVQTTTAQQVPVVQQKKKPSGFLSIPGFKIKKTSVPKQFELTSDDKNFLDYLRNNGLLTQQAQKKYIADRSRNMRIQTAAKNAGLSQVRTLYSETLSKGKQRTTFLGK